MIDEYFDALVDRWCVSIPKWAHRFRVRCTKWCVGWRIWLYLYTALEKFRALNDMLKAEEEEAERLNKLHLAEIERIAAEQAKLKGEEEKKEKKQISLNPLILLKNLFLTLTSAIISFLVDLASWIRSFLFGSMKEKEQSEEWIGFRNWLGAGLSKVAALEKDGHKIRFCAMLFLLALCALGAAAVGGRSMAMTGAALCAMWLSVAVSGHYAPVSQGIRQQYLASSFLRTLSSLMLLVSCFSAYLEQGVPTNVVLQGAMIVLLAMHGVLFMAFIAFNMRQPLFLRMLSGVLGAAPALTAAAAIALAASCLFRPLPLPVSGAAGALGALLIFLAEELTHITNLGGIRLKYYPVWVSMLDVGGYALMLLGAWLYIP